MCHHHENDLLSEIFDNSLMFSLLIIFPLSSKLWSYFFGRQIHKFLFQFSRNETYSSLNSLIHIFLRLNKQAPDVRHIYNV
jgi:hypothetical protein